MKKDFQKRLSPSGTDLTLSPLGLGFAKAGISYGEEELLSLLSAFHEAGGNLIDTARVYNDWVPGEKGRSERMLGSALKKLGNRNDYLIMTKGGHPLLSDMHTPRMGKKEMRSDLLSSLTALSCDHVDIYLYHRDDEGQSVEEEIEVMEEFKKEGLLRYYGCSNWKADRMRQADAYAKEKGYRGFICDQSLCNLALKHMEKPLDDTLTMAKGEVFAYHQENEQNLLMPFSGAAEGYFHHLLSGKTVEGSPYHTEKNQALTNLFTTLSSRYGATPSQVLFGFFFFLPIPTLPLFGPTRVSQLTEVLATWDLPLTKEDYPAEVFDLG